MKNMILVLAILTLGCGTDTEVVEEPPPAAEEADTRVFVVYEVDPTKGNRGESDPPRIIRSNVYPKHERVALSPARLNEDGIFFDFNEDLYRFLIDLSLDGESLGWITSAIRRPDNVAFSITLTPPPNGPFLERGKEYLIDLLAGDKTGDVLELEIRLRTTR